jgi:2-succinyl-5-enolpyruvyl-6-hydroxy-3-cyclohexene-1-carboxylate synthase
MGHFDVSLRASENVDDISVVGEPDHEWLEIWRKADADWKQKQGTSKKLDRRKIVELLWEVTEFDDLIVLGASRMIREADLWAPSKGVQVLSNRGLSGIDGTIATATGAALNLEGSFTRALMGDLTLLHDATSMIEDPSEKINIQLIVVNDGGGSIFESLEMAKSLDAESFNRLFRTQQNFDLWSLANTFGYSYKLAGSPEELESALMTKGRLLIEIRL